MYRTPTLNICRYDIEEVCSLAKIVIVGADIVGLFAAAPAHGHDVVPMQRATARAPAA
jgi:hypothetical protein